MPVLFIENYFLYYMLLNYFEYKLKTIKENTFKNLCFQVLFLEKYFSYLNIKIYLLWIQIEKNREKSTLCFWNLPAILFLCHCFTYQKGLDKPDLTIISFYFSINLLCTFFTIFYDMTTSSNAYFFSVRTLKKCCSDTKTMT